MAAKSLISTILYGHDMPYKPGRRISFGLDTGRPRSAESISAQIVQYLQSEGGPSTLEEIALEIGQNVNVTSSSMETLLQMELIKCTNHKSRLRRYELSNSLTLAEKSFRV